VTTDEISVIGEFFYHIQSLLLPPTTIMVKSNSMLHIHSNKLIFAYTAYTIHMINHLETFVLDEQTSRLLHRDFRLVMVGVLINNYDDVFYD
jgi:hypothetical protein